MSKSLLLILTRNPELGKCKTRLAATVGDNAALEIYKFLLNHTVSLTKDLSVNKWVFYSEEIWEDDIWDNHIYQKKLQVGKDLGERMLNAFKEGFQAGFDQVIIIGSDMYHLAQKDLEEAFRQLKNHDYVVGPAEDGGYYLLGMKQLNEKLFQNKAWGTNTVLASTLKDIEGTKIALLDERNDVDYYEDIKDIGAFQPFLKHIKT
ncbi:TIGR04282 family arsenosugar biosynthesis glycosyltransferase [Flagellimonas aequoris]|uniref:Glycosyltransferase n=1 Tax=Flagellimonas aequoris TaxID=2306997 RepID=A0A418N7N4_9FLAO|nr:TIGR04282 family arsenosugar biosynthesis glycosyltransferase [Allomuricauda aequoris]RIV70899.1 glycosyltransferase [Allomuricauda aequoris]TXK02029.1 glycosyltransferase [Allomuricauda aequoris]